MKERIYILYRQIKAACNSMAFYLCRVFPLDNNLVAVCTFEGKGGFGCNPKPIVEELHKRDKKISFVWFVNKQSWDKQFPNYITKVPNTLWHRAYYLSKAKVWIDNYRKPYGTVKRKGQYYLNVNHYTVGIKCTGLHRGSGFSKMAYLVSKNDSDMIDDLVIDSKWCEQCFDKALVYDGSFLKTGAPRCDVLYGDRTWARNLFRERHHIPVDSNVLLFAPTFREGSKDGKRFVFSEVWTIDFERLLNVMEKKFGGEWYICVRVHPQLAPQFKEYRNKALEGKIIDESQADDMYEILAGMDAYISDYSSAIFEAGFAHIPSFVYADDISEYTKNRGQLMWKFGSYPGPIFNNNEILPNINVEFPYTISVDNDCLESNIMKFNRQEYDKSLDDFHSAIGLVFNGMATSAIADKISNYLR